MFETCRDDYAERKRPTKLLVRTPGERRRHANPFLYGRCPMSTSERRIEAVVFDLLYTLVHPGPYPGGTDRAGWLAATLGIDPSTLEARWASFEPDLEAGRAPAGATGLAPELEWVKSVAAECGVVVSESNMALIETQWDLTRRAALLDPPPSTVDTLRALRARGRRLGVLSNTHALELRAWQNSPIASLVDVVGLSHEIGACKPDPAAYHHVLAGLDVSAARAAYVGDGSNDELVGARRAGFGLVVLAEEASHRWAADDLPRLCSQADASVVLLDELVPLIEHWG
jgi:putative hydrolase of the HAD superfamily